MIKEILKKLVAEKRRAGVPDFVIVNCLKEVLQFPVLNFIYTSEEYKRSFIFTGGSCLRICHSLPRLSEDLDFDLSARDFGNLDLEKMGATLVEYFQKNFLLDLSYRVQGSSRLYLKFKILKELGISYEEGSDFLYVKIEPAISQFKKFDTELTPVSSYGFNFLLKSYDLKFLMTGKIMAILERQWFKGKENVVNIKGRDFYDLYWYLNKNVTPDFLSLSEKFSINNVATLQKVLKKKIEEIDVMLLAYDLKNFFTDQSFVIDFCKNYKEIMKKYLTRI
ncbi:MAG: nucleotidyl transferase AbiEii/AbiGii toxin family protein [Candidatus Gracilibacteria bacterium]|jgi:hypothetical protein